MRSNSNSMVFGRRNGGVHCIGITGVKTGRDIRRANQLEQLAIVPRAFAEVCIQVDR
jgi:hypothetical protein